MIDKKEFIEFDTQVVIQPTSYINKARLTVRCYTDSSHVVTITIERYLQRRLLGPWSCKECVLAKLYQSHSYRNTFRQLHSNPRYYSRVHNDAIKRKISDTTKRNWAARKSISKKKS